MEALGGLCLIPTAFFEHVDNDVALAFFHNIEKGSIRPGLDQGYGCAPANDVIGKQVKYHQVTADQFVEVRTRSSNQPHQNTAASAYSDPGALTIGSGKSYVIQHVKEVAIDHQNGIFAGTNNYIAEIGGQQPMTVKEFITRNRAAFV